MALTLPSFSFNPSGNICSSSSRPRGPLLSDDRYFDVHLSNESQLLANQQQTSRHTCHGCMRVSCESGANGYRNLGVCRGTRIEYLGT